MCRRVGEYISLELFCFVDLTSSCSLIPVFILICMWVIARCIKQCFVVKRFESLKVPYYYDDYDYYMPLVEQ